MIGAIIGDLAGSIYEYSQMKKVSSINCVNIIEDNGFISDDTILTMAILEAALTDKDYEKALRKYALKYENSLPNYKPYFETVFSPSFTKWAHSNTQETSCGNGAMMRISPIGYLFNNEEEVINNTRLATISSHNSPEAIENATIIARIIFNSRMGLSKEEIIKKLNLKIKYPKIEKFNSTCKTTIDVCLYSLFTSNSFDESIRKVLSFGGDTDTNACIVGSMAEAMFGVEKELIEKAYQKLPIEFKQLLNRAYAKINRKEQNLEG